MTTKPTTTTITTNQLKTEGLPEGATGITWSETWSESAAVIEDESYDIDPAGPSHGVVRFDHGWTCDLAAGTHSGETDPAVVVDPNGQLVTQTAYDENWG